jgi:protocatechuate 3,4-dioxygenase beta subunit
MSASSRREFLRQGALGLSAGLGVLTLRADAQPTPESGRFDDALALLQREAEPAVSPAGKWAPTADNILGPFHRPGAPFRAKITPPLEPGDVLLISGRVWAFDTKRPIASALIDVWQANAKGRYDNDDPRNPPAKDVFKNRARLITDENGYYEYETIRPGAYKTGPEAWRPSHIHYLIRARGYKQLITQLYFKGDPHNAKDEFIKASLIIDPKKVRGDGGVYEHGVFDIVLAPA